jgi:hypothetical protein
MEKKRLVINTAMCDARNVSEAVLESYESIQINTATVLISKEANELISRYNVNMNASDVIEAPKDVEMMVQNGKYEISDNTLLSKPVILLVNGTLDIKTSSQEVLDKFVSIYVNGLVSYPSDIKDKLPVIKVNGTVETYPSDAVKLKSRFVMDKIFIMRAKNTKYYARSKVVIPDENLNVSPLVNAGVKFFTKKAVIAESLLEEALPLFDEDVEIDVIPNGYKYIDGQVLTDDLIRKYGDRLYVDGDLTITIESENALNKLSGLKVSGNVLITDKLKDKFIAINPEYKEIKTIKGFIMEDKAKVIIDKRMLDKQEEGITVLDCGVVFIKGDVTSDEIEKKLQFIDCGYINCNEEQKYAVELVSDDVGYINSNEKGSQGGLGDMLDKSGVFDKNAKVINAASYTL